MVRSPLIRFIIAVILIAVIVVATFMYGNSQRVRQARQKEQARQEAVRKQSEDSREEEKQKSKAVLPAEKQDSVVTDESKSDGGVQGTNSSNANPPTTTQIPATGPDGLSQYLAAATLIGLGALAMHRKSTFNSTTASI